MNTVVSVKFDKKIKQLPKIVSKVLPEEIRNASFNYANHLRNKLMEAAVNDPSRPLTPNRQRAAARIAARRKVDGAVVNMPGSPFMLDAMKAHYVALKKGRSINRWAKNNYGNATVSGRSRVFKGPRGGIIYEKGRKSALYVTPFKFIQRTIASNRNQLPNELRKGINKTFKSKAY